MDDVSMPSDKSAATSEQGKPAAPMDESSKSLSEIIPDEVLKEIPEEQRAIVLQSLQLVQASFSGPLPPPQIFRGYEDVLPGSADRILTMAEKEQMHRHQWNSDTLTVRRVRLQADIWMERLGLAAAFVLALFVIGGSFWLINNDKNVQGMVLILGGIGAFVGAFFWQRRREEQATAEPEISSPDPQPEPEEA